MSNLTIAVDDQIIRDARVRAIQQGTSVSAKVREFLAGYAAGAASLERTDPAAELMQMMERVRLEIRQNSSVDRSQPETPSVAKPTLRDTLYVDDFRADARRHSDAPSA